MKIILASRSPRRRELLEQMGIDYEVVDIDINEDWDGLELPTNYVKRLSLEKAEAGFEQTNGLLPVVAADTSVILDHKILGKAETEEQAKQMLNQLSGRSHEVITAVAVIFDKPQVRVNHNRICFRPLSKKEIEDYVYSGEPLGKAGAYAIQGYAACFIERLEGSYSGVMGLPVFEMNQLLKSISES